MSKIIKKIMLQIKAPDITICSNDNEQMEVDGNGTEGEN